MGHPSAMQYPVNGKKKDIIERNSEVLFAIYNNSPGRKGGLDF